MRVPRQNFSPPRPCCRDTGGRIVGSVAIGRRRVNVECLKPEAVLPYELRILDFESAMQDVYDFFARVGST